MKYNIDIPFLNLEPSEQKATLEALIFSSNEPIAVEAFKKIFIENYQKHEKFTDPNGEETDNSQKPEVELSSNYFESLIEEINKDLFETGRPFQITKTAGGYIFSTRSQYGQLLQSLTRYKIKRRLSQAALESLAIIAYKQPITKPEIEQIRGVNSNEVVNALIDKNLVHLVGRKDVMGKPLMYGTTGDFLKAFGLNSLDEMPRLREIDEILGDEESDTNSVTLNIESVEKEVSNELIENNSLILEAEKAYEIGNELN
jgi:segregation and condensation protein B